MPVSYTDNKSLNSVYSVLMQNGHLVISTIRFGLIFPLNENYHNDSLDAHTVNMANVGGGKKNKKKQHNAKGKKRKNKQGKSVDLNLQ